MKRREFLQTTATFSLAAASGVLSRQAFAAQPLDMRIGASDLRVQPVLMYGLTQRVPGRSWRPWGDIQTEEGVTEELGRIDRELWQLKNGADFGVSFIPTARVSAKPQVEALKSAQADALLVYASGGGTDLFEALAGVGKPMVIFVRDRSGPYYLWHEIVDSRFLRSHTDSVKQTNAGLEDVVVDDQGEILWRLRGLYGLKNTTGRRIVCVGGPSGWSCPQAPERARQRFQLDMITAPIPEVNARIETARKDAAAVDRSRSEARAYLDARGVKSQIPEESVAEAFLLKGVFHQLMREHDACAVTTNGCMASYAGIMPCMTLTLINDDGYMAYCESDFVNIPAGILLHFIAGRPTYFCNPTIPHRGRMLFAHCTAPRRMDGQKLEPVTLVTHYESDHGAATHVHFRRGQKVTIIKPDFEAKHWLALTGTTVDAPFLATCRGQIEVALDAATQDVIRNMRGFHCQIAYGDWTREIVYAAKKVGIEVQQLPAGQGRKAMGSHLNS
ncbi:MAG: sugar isomerase [Verrucomicrobia bacterium]|nr:sugar isomerase [Verrucomicrobiota bacterium]MDI9380799.1 sugar isomerase [Verrucomicrobiota bacterium]NMD19604.1 sugar isomerase [Verrucomicrobiota bacterium]HNU98665.1 sugar isomerase [Verrucomicrobiota bacterium]HOA62608.1 sugar isomerase [Verrucomicrobiota bacterium]